MERNARKIQRNKKEFRIEKDVRKCRTERGLEGRRRLTRNASRIGTSTLERLKENTRT